MQSQRKVNIANNTCYSFWIFESIHVGLYYMLSDQLNNPFYIIY